MDKLVPMNRIHPRGGGAMGDGGGGGGHGLPSLKVIELQRCAPINHSAHTVSVKLQWQ